MVKVKKLGNLEEPTCGIGAIKTWDIQSEGLAECYRRGHEYQVVVEREEEEDGKLAEVERFFYGGELVHDIVKMVSEGSNGSFNTKGRRSLNEGGGRLISHGVRNDSTKNVMVIKELQKKSYES